MAPTSHRSLHLAVLILAGTLIGLPWAAGGRSSLGQAGLILLLTLAGAASLLLGGSASPSPPSAVLLLAGIAVSASAVHTVYPDRTVRTLLLLLVYFLASVIAARAARTDSRMERVLLGALLASGLLVVSIGLVWRWQGNDGGLYANLLIGPFGYPNAMGGFLLLVGGAALGTLPRDRTQWERAAALLGCALVFVGLYLTRSRGAAIAAIAGLVVWAGLQRTLWWPRRHLWAGAAAISLLSGLYLTSNRLAGLLPLLWPGAGEIGDTSVLWRVSILRWTWDMIRDHPWMGVGPGAFPVALIHYQRIPYVGGENPHNLYLEIAAEYGLPAAILTILALGVFLVRTGTAVRRLPARHPERARLAFLLASLVAFFVHSAVDLDWSFPAIALAAAALLGLSAKGFGLPRIPTRPFRLWRLAVLFLLVTAAGLALTRHYAATLVAWGQGDLDVGNLAGARQSFSRAHRLNPLNFSAHHGLAWTRFRAGDFEGAIETARQAARIAPLDPSTHALIGDLASAAERWDLAEASFRKAIELAPSAHLRFYAGLLDAAVHGRRVHEAVLAYEQTVSRFTPERVLANESRCLAPGDRYLLARMYRIASRLYAETGDWSREQTTREPARRLGQPDPRGICADGTLPGHTSPEAAVIRFWQAWTEGGWFLAEQSLVPERRPSRAGSAAVGSERPSLPLRGRVAWIAALRGNERQATLVYELELEEGRGRTNRCAQTLTSFRGDGWFLQETPSVAPSPCRP